MDNQNQSGKKLAGLRTFSKDQERASNKTDSDGVGFVVSAQNSIASELTKMNKAPVITETTITKAPIIEQKLAAPKEHRVIDQDKVIHELDTQDSKEKQTDKITSLEQKLHTKKPVTIPIPRLTKKTDADIEINDSDEIISGATIITDTKKDRFKLFPAIGESIKNWFEELQKNRELKKKPKYTVPETTRRKGVIQKATSQTGKITAADHESLQERIKQRLEKEILGFSNGAKTKITWTPKTESVFPLLEAGSKSDGIVNIQIVPRKNFYTKQQEIVVNNMKSISEAEIDKGSRKQEIATEEIIENPNTYREDSVTVLKPEINEVMEKENSFDKQETETETSKILSIATPEINQEIIKQRDDEFSETPKTVNEYPEKQNVIGEEEEIVTPDIRKSRSTSFNISTNLISLILVIIIVTLLFVTGLGENLFKNTSPIEKIRVDHPKLLNSELRFVLAPNTKEEIESLIINENSNSNEINQFVFTTNETGQVSKPSSLLIKLGFGGSANFKQSISHTFFGSINKVPFIALKITDQTTAKGGMLNWEESLSDDLRIIFNLSAENSNKFIDGMISGVDVRVLKNSDNQDEIIYGFTDKNTIIISKDSRTFTELLELTKQ